MVNTENRKFNDYYYCDNASNDEKNMSIIGQYADEDLNPIFFLIVPLTRKINPEDFDDPWEVEWKDVYELSNIPDNKKHFIMSNIL